MYERHLLDDKYSLLLKIFINVPLNFVSPLFPQQAPRGLGKEGCVCHSRANGHHPDTRSVEVIRQLKQSNNTSEHSSLMAMLF
jgi:hypothetical protein